VPIICVVGGLSGTDHSIRGVQLLKAGEVARSLRERPRLLDEESVRQVAATAETAFPEPLPWDEAWMM
jgi:hypothetical protein